MSKITLTPNDQGTGTFTIASPNSNTNRTLTLPDEAGELLINGTTSNVGIGTSSPSEKLVLANGSNQIKFGQDGSSHDIFSNGKTFNIGTTDGTVVRFFENNSEAMRLSGGNLLVGKTSPSSTTAGFQASQDGQTAINRSGTALQVGRLSSDGTIIDLRKDGSTVGNIGTFQDDLTIGTGDTGFKFSDSSDGIMPFNVSTNAFRDNAIDLGHSSVRFDDIYATNGTIQTSDRNEKQDIEALSDAEQRVAVACKGLLRKFRWIDSVAEKGDAARIHFGIIAQDLQDAFAAEGLDAGRYAMFISTTWWETQTDVPAAEAVAAVYEDVVIPAVLDEDGNEVEAERTEQQLVTEAVEAKEAYTRTDTYETLEEAPEGATERTRLGVRYPELLAFIIGAM